MWMCNEHAHVLAKELGMRGLGHLMAVTHEERDRRMDLAYSRGIHSFDAFDPMKFACRQLVRMCEGEYDYLSELDEICPVCVLGVEAYLAKAADATAQKARELRGGRDN